MQTLLRIARSIDALNEHVGRWVYWLVLVVALESAGNAIVRKVFDWSSNALLELQWYLFSAIFMLCAGWTLLHNDHVRIDIIQGRLKPRTQAWIDVFGAVFFLMPMVAIFFWLSVPWFWRSFTEREISGSAGGLLFWPARILVPVGFALLGLQALSELVKRIAFLAGKGPDPVERHGEHAAEAELAEEIRRLAEEKS
ncbi:MAG TPA: TRAP transporter small permease subunit [Usitatibacter sp.]|jgi:TRAP-type mannitol/chloroaromatic compound transport system permease small subunit|nr:TRAP transporter small permease subunit [Usitatibacter sp.]